MRIFPWLICFVVFLVFTTTQVGASPIYVTVAGVVSGLDADLSDIPYDMGDPISCSFIIDKDREVPGYQDRRDGSLFRNYYYAEYIEGGILAGETLGMSGGWQYGMDESFNEDGTDLVHQYISFYGTTNDEGKCAFTSIYREAWWGGYAFEDALFELGDHFVLYTADGLSNCISTSVTVTDVSPVPEPASIFLLGLGLAGLVGHRKKFKG